MKVFGWLIDKWWLPYIASITLIWLWIWLVGFGFYLLDLLPDNDQVIYIWLFDDVKIFALIVPLIAFLTSIMLYIVKKRSVIRGILPLAPFLCVVLLFVVLQPTLAHENHYVSHIGTAWWDNRVYNLARYFPAQEKSFNYVFYECDNFSIYCHAVYRHQFDDWSDDDNLNPPYISADGGTLSLYIRGERVYTYPPERK
jgi:hypothetical protein